LVQAAHAADSPPVLMLPANAVNRPVTTMMPRTQPTMKLLPVRPCAENNIRIAAMIGTGGDRDAQRQWQKITDDSTHQRSFQRIARVRSPAPNVIESEGGPCGRRAN